MAFSGFRSNHSGQSGRDASQNPDYFSDHRMFIEYLTGFFMARERFGGGVFLPSALIQSFRDNIKTLDIDERPPEDLANSMTYDETNDTYTIDLYGASLSVQKQTYSFEIPDDIDMSDPEQYPGVSAEQAYTMMALARANADMANEGIEIFGPPQDMAMYLIAARRANILVTNEQEILQKIDSDMLEEAEAALFDFTDPDNENLSPVIEQLFSTTSNGVLRNTLNGQNLGIANYFEDINMGEILRYQAIMDFIYHAVENDAENVDDYKAVLEDCKRANDPDTVKVILDQFAADQDALTPQNIVQTIRRIGSDPASKHPETPTSGQIAVMTGYMSAEDNDRVHTAQAAGRMMNDILHVARGETIDPESKPYVYWKDTDGDPVKSAQNEAYELNTMLRSKAPDNPEKAIKAPMNALGELAETIRDLENKGDELKAQELKSLGRFYVTTIQDLAKGPENEQYKTEWQKVMTQAFARYDLSGFKEAFADPVNDNKPGSDFEGPERMSHESEAANDRYETGDSGDRGQSNGEEERPDDIKRLTFKAFDSASKGDEQEGHDHSDPDGGADNKDAGPQGPDIKGSDSADGLGDSENDDTDKPGDSPPYASPPGP